MSRCIDEFCNKGTLYFDNYLTILTENKNRRSCHVQQYVQHSSDVTSTVSIRYANRATGQEHNDAKTGENRYESGRVDVRRRESTRGSVATWKGPPQKKHPGSFNSF
jgi:hypothetical protein